MPGIFAITITYIGEEWPPQSVALVMSVYVSGTALGGFMGRIISPASPRKRLSWHWGFLILGVITLAGSALVARWLPQEKHLRHPHADAGWSAQVAGMVRHLRNPRLTATLAVGFNILFSAGGHFFTYVTFYLAEAPFHLRPKRVARATFSSST